MPGPDAQPAATDEPAAPQGGRPVNRRTLLIASGATAAAAAGGGILAFGPGGDRAGASVAAAPSPARRSAPARVTASPAHPAPPTTVGTTAHSVATPHGSGGYRRLGDGPGWPRVVRTELAPARSGRAGRRTAIAAFVQFTDLHVVDVQSPLRFEWMRANDPNDWRPHEALTAAGTVSLIERVNALRGGPVTGHPLSFVVTTGDNTDNNSLIELDWYLTALSGGTIVPNSGDPQHFEGVHNSGIDLYWQPESTRPDADKKAGYPHLPGYLAASMRPVTSQGLRIPWYSTVGNHDSLYGGCFVDGGFTGSFAADFLVGGRKLEQVTAADALRMRNSVQAKNDPHGNLLHELLTAYSRSLRTVTPDERRAPFTPKQYVAAHLDPGRTGPGPVGHGYTADNADGERLYYTFPVADGVIGISLDTTNRGGSYEGSLGTEQFTWLDRTLAAHKDQYALIFSHHTSRSLTNLRTDPARPDEKRHGGPEFMALLQKHTNVLAWINGHSHLNRIEPHGSFWEVNTASHVDYPQLARIIELVDNHDGTLSLITTLIESAAPHATDFADLSQHGLASLYRELAFNAPGAPVAYLTGADKDRNTELVLHKR